MNGVEDESWRVKSKHVEAYTYTTRQRLLPFRDNCILELDERALVPHPQRLTERTWRIRWGSVYIVLLISTCHSEMWLRMRDLEERKCTHLSSSLRIDLHLHIHTLELCHL